MRSVLQVALAGVVLLVSLWLLMYLNQMGSVPATRMGQVLYLLTLLSPSITFWVLLWLHKRWTTHGAHSDIVSSATLIISAMLLLVGVLPGISRQLPSPDVHPAFATFLLASYCVGMSLTLAALLWFRVIREFVFNNPIPGKLALGLAVTLWILDLILRTRLLHVLEAVGVTASVVSASFMVLFFAGLLLALASLLNRNWTQSLFGLGAFVGLLILMVLLRPYVFTAILLQGPTFWLTILLLSLTGELLFWRAAKYLAKGAMQAARR